MTLTIRAAVMACVMASATLAMAQGSMSADLQSRVDAAARDVLAKTGVPSASVGIVQGGRIVFTKAYGNARLTPPLPATAELRYAIGSISKQFTAACVLLLQEEGKLSIDDPVAKYFPELTRAKDVTIRHILSHTSGYEDYAPQDYTIPAWTKPTNAERNRPRVGDQAARLRAGHAVSVQQHQLQHRRPDRREGERRDVLDLPVASRAEAARHDAHHRSRHRARQASSRSATCATRSARCARRSWKRPAGISPTARWRCRCGDLLAWDISLMNRSLLKPASYAAMETDQTLDERPDRPLRARRQRRRCATAIASYRTAAKSAGSWRRTPSSPTTRSRWRC